MPETPAVDLACVACRIYRCSRSPRLRDPARIRRPERAALASAIVFGVGVTAMFAVSGFYHVITWTPTVRRWLARLDHATVYGLIAATYTPFGLLVLRRSWHVTILAVVWVGAASRSS